MSPDSHVNEAYHTCESSWVVRHVTQMDETCHTSEWVMSHIWMRHVSQVNGTCLAIEWPWLIHTCVNESCVWRVTWRVPWQMYLKRVCNTMASATSVTWCVPWLLQMCDVTHSHVEHASFICDMTMRHDHGHSYVPWPWHLQHLSPHVWHVTLWMCDVTHSYVGHGSFICAMASAMSIASCVTRLL